MPDDRSARPSVRDYGAVLVPVAGGVASWSIVLWYSGEAEAFDAQAPYWTVSLAIGFVLGILVGAPRESPSRGRGRALSLAPRLRPAEIGMAMAAGQFGTALVLAEEHTFPLIGVLTLAVSGLVFSAAAGAGIWLRERVRKDR